MQPATPAELRDALAQTLFTSGAMIFSVDPSGCITTWNFAAEELLGYPPAEVLGKPASMLMPEDESAELQALQFRARQGEVVRCHCRRRHRSGRWMEVEMTLAAIETGERAFRGYCFVLFSAGGGQGARSAQFQHTLVAVDQRAECRLAQRLHDDLHQQLLGTAFAIKALSNRAASPVAEELTVLADLLKNAVVKTRDFAAELNLNDLEGLKLIEALQRLGERFPDVVACELPTVTPTKIDGRVAHALLRAAEEAISNAARHSRAGRIDVRLSMQDSIIQIEVRDAGCGFDASGSARSGLGLQLMQAYLTNVGGRCEIDSLTGRGTVVTLLAPLRET